MMDLADVPLVDAIRMMTHTPAQIMKVDDRIGSITPGKDADLIIFDGRINLQNVFLKGKKTDVGIQPA